MNDMMHYTAVQLDGVCDTVNVGIVAAADMLQKLLSQEISISADRAEEEELENIEVFGLIPALLIQVTYTGTISGRCVLIIRQADLKHILNLLMNIDENESETDDELELDDITFNTIRELLNQMLNSYSESLTTFFGGDVTVAATDITHFESMSTVEQYFDCQSDTHVVSLTCRLGIKEIMSSCFCAVLEPVLSDVLIGQCAKPEQAPEEIPAAAIAGQAIPEPVSTPQAPPVHAPIPEVQHNVGTSPVPEPEQPIDRTMHMQYAKFPNFEDGLAAARQGVPLTRGNMDLLMDVPLNVTVEIGKTRRKMRDIMEFSQGTIISLEKQAGAPVDIVVNGQLIARGDVVVIDDNFGVRITDIVGTKELAEKDT